MAKAKYIRKAQKLAKKNITACQQCGKSYIPLCFTFTGVMTDDKVLQVGACCVGSVRERLGFGIYAPPSTYRPLVQQALAEHPWAGVKSN